MESERGIAMGEIDEDEAKRMVLMELMKELGVGSESALSDDLSREQYANDQARDTYAYYGLAMYMAQVFEHEVVNLLVLARIVEVQESAECIVSDPWEQRFRQTLGQLSQQLRPYLEDDQQLMEDIGDGVRVRNRLAHSYWREHAEDAEAYSGRGQTDSQKGCVKN